jgi:hypothetical protein
LFAFFGGGKINRVRVCPSAKKENKKKTFMACLLYSHGSRSKSILIGLLS